MNMIISGLFRGSYMYIKSYNIISLNNYYTLLHVLPVLLIHVSTDGVDTPI